MHNVNLSQVLYVECSYVVSRLVMDIVTAALSCAQRTVERGYITRAAESRGAKYCVYTGVAGQGSATAGLEWRLPGERLLYWV